MGYFPLSLLTKVFRMLFSVHVLKPPLVSLPTPTRGKRNPSERPNPELLGHSARPEAQSSRTQDCTAAGAPRGTRLARSRAAAEPRQRSAGSSPWGAVPRRASERASGRTPRRTWGRERGWARRASAQPRKRRPPGPPRCSAPRPAASSRAPGAGIRGRRGRPELSGGGGGAGRPGSAALLRG